jgi:hypothetical protein
VRVRLIRPPTEAVIDGIRLSEFEVGAVYALPTELATVMIVEGWAVPELETVEPKLPQIKFNIMGRRERRHRIYSDWRLRVELGVAADRRRK